jgi:hypothetical protein
MWWQAELLHYTYVKTGMQAQLTALVSETDEPERSFSCSTVRVSNYKNYFCSQPYAPLNKAGGISEWVASTDRNNDRNDETIFIVDPDSAFAAKVQDPAPFPEGEAYAEAYDYMASDRVANRIVLERHCSRQLHGQVQPVGIYIAINKADLIRLAPLWLEKSINIRSDKVCRSILPDDGWVSEMWGYTIAAAELGIHHHITRFSQPTGSNCLSYPITHYCYPLMEDQELIWIPSQKKKVLWSKWNYRPWELPPKTASTMEGRHLLNHLTELAREKTRLT